MTTLLASAPGPAQAQTHALVIGVNDYPHLPGGRLAGPQPAPLDFGLRQLTSPVVSAVAVVEWLLTRHRNPTAPLGSIELLLSPAAYTPSPEAAARLQNLAQLAGTAEEATFANIKRAAGRWYPRVNADRDNVALFYFCGHGLEASDRYLLASDFGASPADAFDNVVNFTASANSMDRWQAKTQCFFLDACRDGPDELKEQAAKGPVGQPLFGALPGSILDRDAIVYHAAAPGSSALGEPGGQSYFTKALLGCLDGMGARAMRGGAAPVDHASLGLGLKELIDRVAEEKELPIHCEVGGDSLLPRPAVLNLASIPVNVLTIIQCEPAHAQQIASLTIRDATGAIQSRATPEPKPWRLVVPSGKCEVEVEIGAGHRYRGCTVEEIAAPPFFEPFIQLADR